MGNALSIDFDSSGLNGALDKITAAAKNAIRPAAQAGAAVLYAEAKFRAPVSEHAHYFYGTNDKYLFPAGTLRDSIYQAFSKDNSSGSLATYHIAWNHKKAPYGFMVEFGTSRAAAHPFLRPAYDAAKELSLVVAKDKFENQMASASVGVRKA